MNKLVTLSFVFSLSLVLEGCPPEPNLCGGTEELSLPSGVTAVGDSCGACGDGVATCTDENTVVCAGASPDNPCGGCGGLSGSEGDSCGACGAALTCVEDQLACVSDVEQNACGGCESLAQPPGQLCELDEETQGIQRCTGADEVSCVSLTANGCGGEAELEALPGESCGSCGRGVWVCDGTDALTCQDEERGLNTCGGCLPLEGEPGDACGDCGGEFVCSDDGERVVCDDPPKNACGGCASLSGPPGAACTGGGVSYCADADTVVCGEAGGNACGGTETLVATVGESCGECEDGVTVCAGPNTTGCASATPVNLCGGCGFVPGVEGEPCAPQGAWACEAGALVCVFDDEANACGGTAALDETVGAACGTCDSGTWQCDGFDGVKCVGGDEADSHAYPDEDEDGFGDADATPVVQCELENGFVRDGRDCDDANANVHPDAAEVCNGEDDNCNGLDDDAPADATLYYADQDEDGFGAPGDAIAACAAPEGYVEDGTDCNDLDARFNPDAPEDDCGDPTDYNCDGETFTDADEDGYAECVDLCDDDPTRHPGVKERCNEVDDDCNGVVDDGAAVDAPYWYEDGDEDGFGDENTSVRACEAFKPEGRIAIGGDCNDDDPLIHPEAAEICDGFDNNCDGAIDPPSSVDAPTWRYDEDGDGYGGDVLVVVQCPRPDVGFESRPLDCNDFNVNVHPHTAEIPAQEVCDFLDNDCDGTIDNADQTAPGLWFPDRDDDGYGVTDEVLQACIPLFEGAAPEGHVLLDGDCNDDNITQNPSADEIPGDDIDQDCNGSETCFADADGDGYIAESIATVASADTICLPEDGEARYDAPFDDCADNDPSQNPGVAEIPGNNQDDNCDGYELCFHDRDFDGYRPPEEEDTVVLFEGTVCDPDQGLAGALEPDTDCDDFDGQRAPNRNDSMLTAKDENCDGFRGDASNTRFISATSGVDDGTCGTTPTTPCATLTHLIANRSPGFIKGNIAIEDGTYDAPLLQLCTPFAMVGGFCAGTVFSEEGCADFGTVLQNTEQPPQYGTFTLEGGDCLVGNPEYLDVMNLEIRGLDATAGAGAIAPSSVAVRSTIGESRFTNVRIVGGRGGDGTTATTQGGVSTAIQIDTANIYDPRAKVTLIDSEVVLGRGGDALGGGTAEGGPAVGIRQIDGALSVDATTVFSVGPGGGGGLPGGAATERCVDYQDGLYCPDRINRVARRFEHWRPLASPQVEEQFTVRTGDSMSRYTLVTDPGEGFNVQNGYCSVFGGAHLAVFETEEEERAVAAYVAGLLEQTDGAFKVGYTDPVPETVFSWVNGYVSPATRWVPPEPTSGTNNQCASLHTDGAMRAQACEGPEQFVGFCEAPEEEFLCTVDADCGTGRVCCEDADTLYRGCFDDVAGACPAEVAVFSSDGVVGQSHELLAASSADGAKATCEASGRHLARVESISSTSVTEAEVLVDALVRYGYTAGWTGYENRLPGDTFVWPTGVAGASPAPWAAGEPKDNGKGRQLHIHYTATLGDTSDDASIGTTTWVAGDAYDNDVPFVCERVIY